MDRAIEDLVYAVFDALDAPPALRSPSMRGGRVKMFPPIQPPQQPDVPLVDNMFAPELLAGGMSGLSFINGIVTVTFENARCDHTRAQPAIERVVVGRVAMPVPAAQALLTGLYKFLSDHGLNPLEAKGPVTCQ